MTPYSTDRTALFIDGANLYSSAKALNADLDFRKLVEKHRIESRLVRAYYYTAIVEGEEFSPIKPLIDWLDYNGFTLVTKPVKRFTDAQGHTRTKGNMDMEIAVDMLEMAPHLDHAILFSGDGDFRRVVEAVQARGGARHRRLDPAQPAAPDRRRTAPSGGCVCGPLRPPAGDWAAAQRWRMTVPSPDGRGLERTAAQPSSLRERVRVGSSCDYSTVRPAQRLTPISTAAPHPTGLRPATFSHREKESWKLF